MTASNKARPVGELGAMIRAKKASTDLSYERLAARAHRRNLTVSGSYLHQIASGKATGVPSPEMISAIAVAIDATENQVKEAVARDNGLHVEHSINFETSQLLSVVEELPKATRDLWVRMAGALASELSRDVTSGDDGTVYVTYGDKPPGQLFPSVVRADIDIAKQEASAAQRENPSSGR